MKTARHAFLALLFVVSSGFSQTVVSRWRLGESDSGASAGGATLDPTTGTGPSHDYNLPKSSGASPTYSTTTPSSSQTPLGASSMSMNFGGGSGGYGTYGYYYPIYGDGSYSFSMSAYSNQYCIEAWIKPAGTGSSSTPLGIIGIGKNATGYWIMQDGSTIKAIFGNGTSFDTGVTYSGLSTTNWTHVALVGNPSGNSISNTLYVNGAVIGSYLASPYFSSNAEYFSLGQGALSGSTFSGLIDEARYFTFSQDAFTTSMLNYSAIPEPAVTAVLLGAVGLALAGWRRARR